MKLKKKKKKVSNDKFNFDDEYIIGFSNSSEPKGKEKKSKKKKKNKADKKIKNITKKEKRFSSRIIKIILIIFLFIIAVCFLCLSPVFNVKSIIVENNALISSDTINSLSKIELYKNIFLVDKSKAIRNIEKNPYINSVKITRELPDKVHIIIDERKEKYLAEFAEGKYAIIDGQGYILSIATETKQLPILVGIKTSTEDLINIKNNKSRLCEEDLKVLNIVANIMDTAKSYEIENTITKIDISNISNIKLVCESEQKTVYLGTGTEINSKIQFLKEILARESGIKGEVFLNRALTAEEPGFFRESVN